MVAGRVCDHLNAKALDLAKKEMAKPDYDFSKIRELYRNGADPMNPGKK